MQQPMFIPYQTQRKTSYRKNYRNYRKTNAYAAGRALRPSLSKRAGKKFYACNKRTKNPGKCYKKAVKSTYKWKLQKITNLNAYAKVPRKGFMGYKQNNKLYFVKDTPQNRAKHPDKILYLSKATMNKINDEVMTESNQPSNPTVIG